MICGAKISTRMVTTRMAATSQLTDSARQFLRAIRPPCVSSARENIGTNAVLNAPSANSRRNRLGKRKAALKASDTGEMPSTAAISASRKNPKMRETRVRPPTERKLRVRLMGPAASYPFITFFSSSAGRGWKMERSSEWILRWRAFDSI